MQGLADLDIGMRFDAALGTMNRFTLSD